MTVVLIVAALVVTSSPAAENNDRATPTGVFIDDRASGADDTRAQREQARLRAHFATVIAELEAADVTHMSDTARLSRARLVDELRLYAARGRFPLNRGNAPHLAPIFVDDAGTHCAMGHLLALTGAGPLVDEIRATQNLAYIADLAFDPRLHAWLDAHGLSLFEAGRIQPGYSSEEPMVAGLCVVAGTYTEPMADTAILIVDATMQSLVESQEPSEWWPARDLVELTVDGVAAVVQPCTGQLCAALLENVVGLVTQDFAERFVVGEERRGLVVATLVDGALELSGMGLFAADAKYGDNRDGAAWLRMAAGPLVHIPDDVLIAAFTAGSNDACLDVLLAHDAVGLCHEGVISTAGSQNAFVARGKCLEVLDTEPDGEIVQPEDPEVVDDQPPPEPVSDDEDRASCAAAPAREGVFAVLLGLAWFMGRRRATHAWRAQSRHIM
jgi:hypothetical protein